MEIKDITKFKGETVLISDPPYYNKQYMRFSPTNWWEFHKDSECEKFVYLNSGDCVILEHTYQNFKRREK